MSACKSIKPNFYANEDLNPVKNPILFALRKIKREFPGSVKGAGSRDGRVYVQCKNSPPGSRDKKIHVNSYEHQSQLCHEYTGKRFLDFFFFWRHMATLKFLALMDEISSLFSHNELLLDNYIYY